MDPGFAQHGSSSAPFVRTLKLHMGVTKVFINLHPTLEEDCIKSAGVVRFGGVALTPPPSHVYILFALEMAE